MKPKDVLRVYPDGTFMQGEIAGNPRHPLKEFTGIRVFPGISRENLNDSRTLRHPLNRRGK
jgi:hypothetical protein